MALLLLCLGLGAILALALAGGSGFDAYFATRLITIIESAAVQASLSTFCSALIAIPASVAIVRLRQSRLRACYQPIRLICGAAFITPTTVIATGLLALWGRQGLLAEFCQMLGFGVCDSISIYGLHGVVLAHMALNIPLMLLVFLPLLESIPSAHYGLAHHLGMGRRARFRLIEFPAIRPALIGVSVLVFLLCFSSFALVLMLGGGPRVTTLEVEIYSAIRFDADFTSAAGLSLVQLTLAAAVVAVMAWLGGGITGTNRSNHAPHHRSFGDARLWDSLVLAVVFVLVLLPIVMVVVAGVNSGLMAVLAQPRFFSTILTSVNIACVSAVVTLGFGLILGVARARLGLAAKGGVWGRPVWGRPVWGQFLLDAGVMLYLVIPSIVLGVAAFIVLRGRGDAFSVAFFVVVLANTLLALPFAVRILEGRLRLIFTQHDRTAVSLGVSGWHRWRVLTLPLLEREIGIVLGLSAAISMGDLGVIALFASDSLQTVPWLLYQLGGRYQAEQAKALALILLLMAVALLLLGRYLPRVLRLRVGYA